MHSQSPRRAPNAATSLLPYQRSLGGYRRSPATVNNVAAFLIRKVRGS